MESHQRSVGLYQPKLNSDKRVSFVDEKSLNFLTIVKLREREGQGVDPGRSLKGHLWIMDGGWWYTFP